MEDVFPYRILRCGSIVTSASPSETKGNHSKVVVHENRPKDPRADSAQVISKSYSKSSRLP